ncbi:MBL fold metallo-hydrolase [Methylobacillus arboreus]|uniref:MBL fold metallo-hydrolase n=1 Tax=Methylobacillus arboreus TaxID=755170 RepID=UPI001E3F3C86|nr:MBL fold metallo-hydrolase [Methylobacillus arboreus]MCB5191006.1 MBL fold metallo-hydrolase [Methylobacillus arboreus]
MKHTSAHVLLSIAVSLALTGYAQAEDKKEDVKPPAPVQAPARDFSKVEIKTTKLADDFYILEGQGGTISVLTGPEGVFLVDTQFAPLTEKLVAAIKKISDKPIRFLVNTHVHGDHTGGNENFAKLGATIFSRDQLRNRLIHPNPAADGTPGKPAPAQALPVVTYDGPVTVHLNGEDIRLIPVRNAHTDGDTLVYFVKHDILATGDYHRSVGYPVVDLNSGGTLNGIIDGLGATIGRAGPNTRIIPGHGPVTDRNNIVAQRDLILAVRDKVAVLVAQNKSLEEVIAAKPTADFDASVQQSAETSERFIKWLYAELKKAQ